MRSIVFICAIAIVAGCDFSVPGWSSSPPQSSGGADDCRACINPDSPECSACLGSSTPAPPGETLSGSADQIAVSEPELSFGIIGDTRPAVIDDTAGYPTAVITKIFQDLEAENPRPGFAVGTGDYQFSKAGGSQTSPQLDKYLAARAAFSNAEYPAMGNHECTGATASNCGPGTTNGLTSIFSTFKSKILTPLGLHDPYYSLLVTPPDNSWSAKIVFVAANYWTPTQASWLTSILSQPTTYTFIVRHESSSATTAPGVTPSGQIIAQHPYTMLIVGHDHPYKRMSQKEVLVGNGGAPLTTGSVYGYGVVRRRSDGAVQFTFYNYQTHAVLDSFAVNADGSAASNAPAPPPQSTFSLAATPASVTSNGASATSTITLTAQSGFTGSATLAASGVPSGALASFGTSALSSGGNTNVTLSPGTASAGTYSILVTGTDGAETESTSVSWTIAGGGTGTCSHAICTTGIKLVSSCDSCVTQVCNKDSWCCTHSWDSACVAEVGTICGESCP